MLDVNALRHGESVCAFIRHGEKDCEHFCLTENGKTEVKNFGELVSSLGRSVQLFSSPEPRCMETACLMGEILHGSGYDIQTSPILGKPGVQVKREERYSLLTDQMRCRDIYRGWKNGLHRDAMHSPEIIKDEILRFLKETSLRGGITIYISQSGTIACAGFSLGLTDYKADEIDWVRYLDGFVVEV